MEFPGSRREKSPFSERKSCVAFPRTCDFVGGFCRVSQVYQAGKCQRYFKRRKYQAPKSSGVKVLVWAAAGRVVGPGQTGCERMTRSSCLGPLRTLGMCGLLRRLNLTEWRAGEKASAGEVG